MSNHLPGGRSTTTFGSRSARGFTLIELLLAVVVFAIVLAAVHGVFRSAIRLRNKTVENLAASVPIQQALGIIQRDLANLVLPGGAMSGSLQSMPSTTGGSNSAAPSAGLRLGQVGPAFYTSVGTLQDRLPWGEVEKVVYRLVEPTNDVAGLDLVRSVTRNLLPPVMEEAEDQFILQGVEQLKFLFHDGSEWQEEWDSTTESTVMPGAIKVQLMLASSRTNLLEQDPIEIIVPVQVQAEATTTSANSTGGSTP